MKWPEIEYFIERLTPNPSPAKERGILRILDVGCGSGRLLGELRVSGIEFEYLGIDSSSGMIDEAQKAYPEADFRVLDMGDIDTLDGKFDAVFFLASFHHLETETERVSVLEKLRGILATGGVVYMTNWNLLSEENMKRYRVMYRGNGDFDIKIGTNTRYYHGFTLDELDDLFKKTDFRVIENRVFGGERNIIARVHPV